MARVVVVTDSGSNIPTPLASSLPLVVVPILLQLDGRLYRDEVDMSADQFYGWQLAHPDAPYSTSCPSPGEFCRVYEDLASSGAEGVVSVHLAGGLSTTLDSAAQAADLFRRRNPGSPVQVELVDSGSVSMAQGFTVLAATRAAQAGASREEVAQAARQMAPRVKMYAIVKTLRYVVGSGRVPSLVRYFMAQVPVRPLLRVGGGKVGLVRVEHTYKRAVRRLLDITVREAAGSPVHMAIMHAAALEEAQELAAGISASCDCRELVTTQFTPVMGAHTGPGLLGVAFYTDAESA